ncbi:hypothetical protein DFH11DRAFT_1548465 [Phellopilus nigrolimitatus]|nr:hypothetical protein DFH11DRAFT_1548465 [Phellopilus nigrolimitatus]
MYSIRSDVEPVDPSLAPLIISETNTAQYAGVAILALLVYDAIITMDKEIKYFWNRYIGILGAVSSTVRLTLQVNETLCLGFFWIQSMANILLMRVLALYHQDKRLAACLRTLFGLEAAFGLGIIIYSMIYQQIVVGELAKGVTFCGVNRYIPKVWDSLSWAAPLLYAIILMILALYKAEKVWRENTGFSQFNLVKVLIQDQAIYFIIGLGANYPDRVIFCSVMEIISAQLDVSNILLADFMTLLGSPSLLCVLGSHLLVHLKEAGERGVNEGMSYKMKTISNIEFS